MLYHHRPIEIVGDMAKSSSDDSANTGGSGQDTTIRTNSTAVVMPPSSPPDGTPTGCANAYINIGSYATPMLMSPSSLPNRMTNRRWCLHQHHQMVRLSDVDVSTITVGWYARLALTFPLSALPDWTLIQRWWTCDSSTISPLPPSWNMRNRELKIIS